MARRGRPAYDKYSRVSHLLAALAESPRGLTRAQLMAVIGLESGQQRMFERDIRDARKAGWKIATRRVDDEYRYQIHVVDHRLRSMFSGPEAEQLLRAARHAGLGQLYEDLGAAGDGRPGPEDDARLAKVRYAIQHRCRLQFDYHGSRRDVHPYDVFRRPGRWYFRGREEGADLVKKWKFADVLELTVSPIGTADLGRNLPDPNLDPLLQQRHEPIGVTVRVGKDYRDQAASALGAGGFRSLGQVSAGTVDVEFTVTNLESFRFRLAELGERALLVGPAGVRDSMRAWLETAAGVPADRGTSVASPERLAGSDPTAGRTEQAPQAQPAGVKPASVTGTTASGTRQTPDHGRRWIESGLPGLLLPDLGELLSFQEGPVSLVTAARELGTSTEEIRRQVDLLHDLDATERFHRHGLDPRRWPIRIEPISGDPGDADLLVMEEWEEILPGTEMFDAQVLGPLYLAAELLAMREPDNPVIADAASRLRERFLPGFRETSRFKSDVVQVVAAGINRCAPVEITYARAWAPGVTTRVIHPYLIAVSRRGLEVEAEPAEKPGQIQTFLISNIERATLLPGDFQRPADVEARCQRHREQRRVAGVVPRDRKWVVEKWAEQVEFRPDRSGMVRFTAMLAQPFEERTALMLLQAGPDTIVDPRPGERRGSGGPTVRLALRLLEHHGLRQPPGTAT